MLKTTDAWKNRYPKAAIKKVFKLNEKLSTALQDYNNRIENGTSMIALLPKSYHDSKSLSVIIEPSLIDEFPFVARVVNGMSLP